jgi:hypothetical protein
MSSYISKTFPLLRNGLDMSNNGKVLEMYEDMAKRE